MDDGELDGCWLKVTRANFHLKALNAAILRFRDPATNALFHEFDAATGEHVILVDTIDPPETWSAEIGNVLYNLHSSLDHLAWKLATRARYGEPPPSGTRATFPIFKNRGEFWARARLAVDAKRPHRARALGRARQHGACGSENGFAGTCLGLCR